MATAKELFERRKARVRTSIRKKGSGRVRLSVFRSQNHIYAQLIDDSKGVTLAAASSLTAEVRERIKTGANKNAAREVGLLIGRKAKEANIIEVVFDKGGYLFHGRVKELADAARESGLEF